MVGTGVGAQHGILFRNGEVLETLHHIKSIVLDKTGTLTEGQMTVHAVKPAPGIGETELLTLAASLERGSEHPLAAAVLDYCAERSVAPSEITDFKAADYPRAWTDGIAWQATKNGWKKTACPCGRLAKGWTRFAERAFPCCALPRAKSCWE